MGPKLRGWIRGAPARGVTREHLESDVADGFSPPAAP